MTTHGGEKRYGPRCRECRRSEADCAWEYPCCEECRHWRHLDRLGNDVRGVIEHGTERGYQQHRYRDGEACVPCRTAHAAHVQWRAAS